MGWSRERDPLAAIKDRGASRRKGTSEGRKGNCRACGDPVPAAPPEEAAQMWVPGPYQKFPFRSSGVGEVQGPEFLRSTQSASLHSEARGLPFPAVAESGAVCGADRRASRKQWWTERGVAQKPH